MADDTTTAAAESSTTETPTAEPKPAAPKKKPAAKKKTAKKTVKKTAKKRVTKKTSAKKAPAEPSEQAGEQTESTGTATEAPAEGEADEQAAPKKKPARRKRTTKKPAPAAEAVADDQPADDEAPDASPDAATDEEDAAARAIELDDAAPDRDPIAEAPSEMIINYTPGEECRIAIIEDGKLEEFDAEPTENVSRVGNIYRGKVVNIERNIQAAFVDFGTDNAGFLHLSDLHPRYFPGADVDETEKVGRKTPRRQRPPIEQALKKGQEITVQVLKEGVGTKGPTLTSYLSIPGRFLVMMPDMDKVGVSRKVEDEDLRRKMRKILDQLELPSGFGFILRTAGLERTKADLKRDLAYLQRLWKDMERRQKKGRGPALLYSEADLLLRTLRDRVTNQVKRVVIDNKAALARAAGFMKIVAPRSTTKLCHYDEARPVFHAFGIEQQLDLMQATEVPLPSGGALVIEQTEALVAIDVNSGRSRGARDAESNAYNTNVEAVDEICRQLRLRDQGGLVICDLIDMRHASNRKDIENRIRERLKRDRARSTTLAISAFGILEMTRQRMRGSYEQQHFHTCPRCTGRGLIQRPDSVAASVLRDLTALLEHDRVHRVELVVSPVVAGALLSTRRGTLGRIERLCGKRIDVHVKETLASGRVVMYAYDHNGADIDVERLPKKAGKPRIIEWADTDLAKQGDWAVDLEREAEELKSEQQDEIEAQEKAEAERVAAIDMPGEEDESGEPGGKKKRRRRRRRRGKGEENQENSGTSENGERSAQDARPETTQAAPTERQAPRAEPTDSDSPDESDDSAEGESSENGGKKKRRRRRRRGRGKSGEDNGEGGEQNRSEGSDRPAPSANEPEAKPAKPRRRSLYGSGRRTLSASEKGNIERD